MLHWCLAALEEVHALRSMAVQYLSGDSSWACPPQREPLGVDGLADAMHACKKHACKENICQPSAGNSSQLLLDGFKISTVRKSVCLFTGGGLTSTPSSSGKARCRRTAGGGKGGRSTSAAPRPSPPSTSVPEPYLRKTTRGRSRAEERSAQGLLAHVMAHAWHGSADGLCAHLDTQAQRGTA